MPTEKRKMSTSPRASASGVASSTTCPADLAAGRARRGEHAHVLEAVLAEQAERDGADGAGAADDADAGRSHARCARQASEPAPGGPGSHDLAPADERAAERDLVGVLEVAADGEAAREARHPHLRSRSRSAR